jgi:hypothetical protein
LGLDQQAPQHFKALFVMQPGRTMQRDFAVPVACLPPWLRIANPLVALLPGTAILTLIAVGAICGCCLYAMPKWRR